MKTAIIYVFSGTGNTKRICELYRAEFSLRDVETTLYDVKGGFDSLPSPDDYDLVGFAYPIHGFNAPHVMLDLARALPKRQKGDLNEYFVLKSSGEPLKVNNISSYKMRSLLKRRGYVQFAEYHYVMPYNMIFRHTDEMATRMWDVAKSLAPIEAREVLSHTPHMLKGVPFGRFIAWVLRIEQPAMRLNGRMFRVDKRKCVNCGKCVKACPMGNIVRGEDGKFRFRGDCVMCARCSFNCPTDAFNIAMLNGWRVNGRYNMEYRGESQKNSHSWYCKRAYERYFSNAVQKIRCANQNNDVK